MDYELYNRIKKCNLSVLRDLQASELPWAYFVCYRMTKDVGTAAELLRKTWMETISMIVNLGGCPRDSFRAYLARELFRLCDTVPKIEDDDLFSSFEVPRIAQKFDFFIKEIDRMEHKERKIYLLNKLGDLSNGEFSEILDVPLYEAKEYLYALERKAHPRENGNAYFELMHLSNEFKGTNKRLFEQITIPELFISTLEHDYTKIFNVTVKNGKNTKRKEPDMKPTAKSTAKPTGKSTQPNRRAAAKKKKTIIISCVAAVLAIALIITLVVVIKKANSPALAITTQYKIDEVTVGDVSTTISGSGSLTPVTSQTLTAVDLLSAIEAEIYEVTAFDEENQKLSLTVYGLAEGNEDYEITNIMSFDLSQYEATTTTKEYTIASTDKFYTISLASITEIESTELAVGDMLVKYNGGIVVYHAESEEEEAQAQSSGSANGSASGSTSGSAGSMPSLDSVTIPEIVGGTIQSVNVQAGDAVSAGDVIAVIEFEDSVVKTRDMIAPYNAVILEWYLKEGAEISDETSVGMFLGTDDGYTMTISVDENNISLIELGQEVEISIDVSSEDMPTGYVTDISYNGSTSGSTTAYKITVNFDYVTGTYPGMSVSAEVVVEDSGEGLLVPVSAIQTSGDTKYVYFAPSGASLGDIYEDGEIDVTKLTKVTVTEGMSDGSYTMVEGNLDEGDLIVVITKTSTQTGSESSNGSGGGMGGMGNFPGGGSFPGGDFDPSQIPSGGFPGGGSFPGFN